MESQSAMQTWFFSAGGSSDFTTETCETGTVQAHSSTLLKPIEPKQPATISQTHPRSTGSKLPPFTCFPFFSTSKIAATISILKCHKCIRKKNAVIFFFSVSEIWLSWMSIPKSSVIYEKWSLLFSECLMILKEDKLTLDLWKKGKMNSNISTDCMS